LEKGHLASEELRQLNLKKLQFILKQEHRNNDSVKRLVELVTSLCTFFRMLPRSLQYEVCKVMRLETFVRNEVVFTTGDLADKFYIVANGRLEVCVNDAAEAHGRTLHSVAVLQRGDSFGEVALMMAAPRTATVVVHSTRAELLTVAREDFHRVLHDIYGISVQERLLFLRSLSAFQTVPTFKLEAVAHLLQAVIHPAGTVFDLRDGTVYFVTEGECQLKRGGPRRPEAALAASDSLGFYTANTVARLGPGEFFGEPSAFPELRQDGWYVESHTECKLYTLSAAELVNSCDRSIADIVRRAGEFKADFHKRRLGRAEQQRGAARTPQPASRTAATPSRSRPSTVGSHARGRGSFMGSVPGTPKASRRREEEDLDEREFNALEELKQHIFATALELEKQRLEMSRRGSSLAPSRTQSPFNLPPVGLRPGSVGTWSSFTNPEANRRRRQSLLSPSASPVPLESERLDSGAWKATAYPLAPGESPSAKQALLAAGGLQLVAPESLHGTPGLLSAAPANGTRGADCAGYMQVGGRGYIGYDTKHTRLQVANWERHRLQG